MSKVISSKDKGRPLWVWPLVIAVLIIVFGVILFLCKRYDSPKLFSSFLTENAVSHIKAGLDIPDSFLLVRSEEPDSAYGVYWFTDEEQRVISDAALSFSMSLLDDFAKCDIDSVVFDGPSLSEMKVYGPMLQKAGMVLMESREREPFSGWKVKTVYTFCDASRRRYTATRWTFFDRSGEKILGKVELPGDIPANVSEEY